MLLFDIDKIENTEIDIYFKYDYLDTSVMCHIKRQQLNRQ